jgi:hypothetical protein
MAVLTGTTTIMKMGCQFAALGINLFDYLKGVWGEALIIFLKSLYQRIT